MRNNALFRLLTVLLIALGLGLFLGGSFSPAMEVIASGNRKSFKASAPAGATFRVDAPYFLMMIGVVIFLLLSILAIVLALLPEEKKEAEKAA
jgi:hypothetical protein